MGIQLNNSPSSQLPHNTSNQPPQTLPHTTINMSANPGNVVGGHKANLNNPNTSDESKQLLQEIENGGDANAVSSSGGDKNPNNVAGGLKATLNNPNTSDEAKQSAKERLGQE